MIDHETPGSEFKSGGGLKRVVGAFVNSIAGFRSAWKTEHAFRQELMVAVPAGFIALILPVPPLSKLLLIAVLLLVLIVEMINSAIEAAIDRISLERHPLSKRAKDYGSAAVFLALLLAAAAWGVVVLPLFLE